MHRKYLTLLAKMMSDFSPINNCLVNYFKFSQNEDILMIVKTEQTRSSSALVIDSYFLNRRSFKERIFFLLVAKIYAVKLA